MRYVVGINDAVIESSFDNIVSAVQYAQARLDGDKDVWKADVEVRREDDDDTLLVMVVGWKDDENRRHVGGDNDA